MKDIHQQLKAILKLKLKPRQLAIANSLGGHRESFAYLQSFLGERYRGSVPRPYVKTYRYVPLQIAADKITALRAKTTPHEPWSTSKRLWGLSLSFAFLMLDMKKFLKSLILLECKSRRMEALELV